MTRPSDPFELGDGPDACLLLHGLTGSPAEVRPVGEALAQAGFRAVGPLLPGHGTSAEDLYTVTRGDLLKAAESALLSLRGARRICLCGLSAGALVAIHLAARSWTHEGLPDLSALALLAPAIEFAGTSWLFAEILGRLPALPFIVGKGARDIQGADDRVPVADGSYGAIPLRWGPELHALSHEALQLARRVRAPALILQGARDKTLSPRGAQRLARQLASSKVEVRILQQSGHVLPLDVESGEVCSAVVQFFQGEQ
jgi:carboxylesterase